MHMEIGAGTNLGRYQLLAEIGRGAMGTVYQALDPEIDRLVAIKTFSLVNADSSEGQAFRARFAQEAKAAGRLTHPGIVTIYDRGEEPSTNTPYIVMEYVAGQPLSALIAQANGRLEERFALQVAKDVAEALAYAHEKGVVHRDIKPANILISEEGNAKIADFGVARLDLSNLTLNGEVFGTPAFMAPEQITGGTVDGRSDLFSLGAILYTMLIGFRPFQGNSLNTVGFKVVNQEPVPITSFHLDLSKDSEYVVARAMAKSPASRYQTGIEFALDLGDILEGREPRSRQDQTVRVSSEVFRVSDAYKSFASLMAKAEVRPKHISVFPDPPSTGKRKAAAAPALSAEMQRDPSTKVPAANLPEATAETSATAQPNSVSEPAPQVPTNTPFAFVSGRWATIALLAIACVGAAVGLSIELMQRRALHAADAAIGMPALYAAIMPPIPHLERVEDADGPEVTVRKFPRTLAKVTPVSVKKAESANLDYTIVQTPRKTASVTPTMIAATSAAAVPVSRPTIASVPQSTLVLSLEHHFSDADFSVWVDNKLAYSGSVHGESKKRLLLLRGVEGKEIHEIHFPSGAHDIKVRVVSTEAQFDHTESIHGTFKELGKPVLSIRCTKHGVELKLNLGS